MNKKPKKNKLIIILYSLFTLTMIGNFFIILNGSTASIPAHPTSPNSRIILTGISGLCTCILFIVIYICCISSEFSKDKKDINKKEEKLYCNWWIQDKNFYCEDTPLTKMEFPKNNICPICKKAIKIIDIYKK